MNPGEANDLANRIVGGLVVSMPAPTRMGLRGVRMIDKSPPFDSTKQIARAFRAIRLNESDDHRVATEVWSVVYSYGHAVPDDIVA
jgi:hypothetical protein